MYLFKNKSVINATYNSTVLLSTYGKRAPSYDTISTSSQPTLAQPAMFPHRLWSGIAVTIVAATRLSCHQSVPVPATSAHYHLVPRRDPEVSISVRLPRPHLPPNRPRSAAVRRTARICEMIDA